MDTTPPVTRERERTTRVIAFGLLFTFIGSFAVLIAASLWLETRDSRDPQLGEWFDLLKNSFILIGTALTTLIGYYFGQHETARAHARADEAEQKRREAEERLAAIGREAARGAVETNPIDERSDDSDFATVDRPPSL